MADILRDSDLPEAVLAAVGPGQLATMLAGVNAKAVRHAPCLGSTDPVPTDAQLAEAKLILLGAVSRWARVGEGAVQSQTAGPFSVATDTRERGGYNLWPSEVEQLRALCVSDAERGGAFTFDVSPALGGTHAPWCNVNFGANYCSCGADIAGYPIYEQP
jgi:hypothetical protein